MRLWPGSRNFPKYLWNRPHGLILMGSMTVVLGLISLTGAFIAFDRD